MCQTKGSRGRYEKGSIATYVAFLNAWVPAALAAPDRALVVTYTCWVGIGPLSASSTVSRYEGLSECPLHVLDLIVNCALKWRIHCSAMKRAVSANNFNVLKNKGLNSSSRKDAPTNLMHVQESSKFRSGKAHSAHELLSPIAFLQARRSLEHLNPVVRDLFRRSSEPCFVFEEQARRRLWCRDSILASDELVCS